MKASSAPSDDSYNQPSQKMPNAKQSAEHQRAHPSARQQNTPPSEHHDTRTAIINFHHLKQIILCSNRYESPMIIEFCFHSICLFLTTHQLDATFL